MSINGKREFEKYGWEIADEVQRFVSNSADMKFVDATTYTSALARLNEAEVEVKLAKRTLAEYEHECETINEMKTQLTLAEALIKELETALEGCPCTEMFRPILAHTKYCEKCAILAKLA